MKMSYTLKVNTTLWADSADNKLMIFFLLILENRDLTLQANCLLCQVLFLRKNKNITKCRLLKFLPSMQSIKGYASSDCLIQPAHPPVRSVPFVIITVK